MILCVCVCVFVCTVVIATFMLLDVLLSSEQYISKCVLKILIKEINQ